MLLVSVAITTVLFFNINPLPVNTFVSALYWSLNPSCKTPFWLLVQRVLHRLLNFFVTPELSSRRFSFQCPKHMKIWRRKVWWVLWIRETLKMWGFDFCNRRMGCVWPSIVMQQRNTSSEWVVDDASSEFLLSDGSLTSHSWYTDDCGPLIHAVSHNSVSITICASESGNEEMLTVASSGWNRSS